MAASDAYNAIRSESFSVQSDDSEHKARRAQSGWSRGISRCLSSYHRSVWSGVLLDMTAMAKSLMAALSIVYILNSQIAECYSLDIVVGEQSYTIPEWYILNQCQPTLNYDTALTMFKAFIIGNQLTFGCTSLLLHSDVFSLHSNRKRAGIRESMAYILGMLSFIFGFCKIVIVVFIGTTTSQGFACDFDASTFADKGSATCSDKQIVLDQKQVDFGLPSQVLNVSCYQRCYIGIPVDVYTLSITFALTFIYSVFMCYSLIHPEAKSLLPQLEYAVGPRVMEKLEAEGVKEDDGEDDDDDNNNNNNNNSDTKAAGTDEETGAYQEQAKSAPDDSDSLMSTAAASDSRAALLSSSSSPSMVVRRHAAAAAASSSGTSDGLVKRALSPAMSSAPSDDIDPSMRVLRLLVNASRRRFIARKIRSNQLIYRVVRDIACMLKYGLTLFSICFIMYTATGTIMCDSNIGVLSAQAIWSACGASFYSFEYPFIFAVAGIFIMAVFVAITVLEKLVLFPHKANGISAICIIIVILLIVVQCMSLNLMYTQRIVYPCTQMGYTTVPGSQSMWNITQQGVCADNIIVVSGESIVCSEHCHVSLSTSTYILFSSILLTLVYVANLAFEYRRLARVFIKHRLNYANAFEGGYDGDTVVNLLDVDGASRKIRAESQAHLHPY